MMNISFRIKQCARQDAPPTGPEICARQDARFQDVVPHAAKDAALTGPEVCARQDATPTGRGAARSERCRAYGRGVHAARCTAYQGGVHAARCTAYKYYFENTLANERSDVKTNA